MALNNNKMKRLFVVIVGTLLSVQVFAQKTCTSNPTTLTASINFGDITWTASGGATVTECNNMADGLITFIGNVVMDIANNKKVTISNNVNIDGSFLVSGGSGSDLSINGGGSPTLLYVTGDLGDAANNGVKYQVINANDSIRVDGTIYGKNNNGFTGQGGISGGTLNVKNGTTCGSPCPVAGNFDNCVDGDGFCTTNGVLPIELGSFTAKVLGNSVKLNWVTLSEINNDYFSIEKSLDGINYRLLTTVSGAGNSSSVLDYSYVDRNPVFGKSYYRLMQTDFDGASETFAPIAIEFTSLENGKLSFSNPVNAGETVSIFTNAEENEKLSLSVFSMVGHEILNEEFFGSSYEFKIDASVEPGIYFVKISSVNSERTGRLVVK